MAEQRSTKTAKKGTTRKSNAKRATGKSDGKAPDPLGLLVLTRERIEDVINDAVERGRMTSDDAQDLVTGLVERARSQISDATAHARNQADPVIAQADRARRAAGLGPTFPISGYDDLTANQVQKRLADLSPAELRKVRDYERRNANRKTVLDAISNRLD